MNEIETFYGVIENTADALRIFELCRQGRLARIRRRLHDKERPLIRSGSVFVFDEQESGIKRWTDGRLWSPSRILGNFLIYRELEKKTPSTTASSSQPLAKGIAATGEVYYRDDESVEDLLMSRKRTHSMFSAGGKSVVDPASVASNAFSHSVAGKRFLFREGGLIKKTISITIQGHVHHLICYYTRKDFLSGALTEASAKSLSISNELLSSVEIGQDLINNQSFRKADAEEIYKKSSLLEDEENGFCEGESVKRLSQSHLPSVSYRSQSFVQPRAYEAMPAKSNIYLNAPSTADFSSRWNASATSSLSTGNSFEQLTSLSEGIFNDIESEFGHIAATLAKLTPRQAISPPSAGILPPITGESFVGDLPSLCSLNDIVERNVASNSTNTSVTFTEPLTLIEEQFITFPSLEAAPDVKLPAFNDLSHDISPRTYEMPDILSLPCFPSVSTTSNCIQKSTDSISSSSSSSSSSTSSCSVSSDTERQYEERLKQALFGSKVQI